MEKSQKVKVLIDRPHQMRWHTSMCDAPFFFKGNMLVCYFFKGNMLACVMTLYSSVCFFLLLYYAAYST